MGENTLVISATAIDDMAARLRPQELYHIRQKVENHLVDNYRLSFRWAGEATSLLLRAMEIGMGKMPHHTLMVVGALAQPAAQAILNWARGQMDAELARQAAMRALKDAEAAQQELAAAQQPAPKKSINWSLTVEEEGYLQERLLAALQSGKRQNLERAVMEVYETCMSRGQKYFVTQFRNWTIASGQLISVLKATGLVFWFRWDDENGLDDAAVYPAVPEPGPAEKEEARKRRQEAEERREANRKLRLQAQPAKGVAVCNA